MASTKKKLITDKIDEISENLTELRRYYVKMCMQGFFKPVRKDWKAMRAFQFVINPSLLKPASCLV